MTIEEFFLEPIPEYIERLVEYQDSLLRAYWLEEAILLTGELGDNELIEFREDFF